MDLTNYLNKRVHIVLTNGFTYIGLVIQVDNDSLTIVDKNSKQVCLKESYINIIKETN